MSYRKRNLVMLTFITSLVILFAQLVIGQESTTSQKKMKNTIRFNLTNPVLFGKSLIFGYERVINPRQTFSVNIGTTGFPSLGIISADSIQANTLRDESGYNISVDYRFYLAKENKFEAPRGVYIGPYYSFNTFDKKHSWSLKSTSGSNVAVDSDLRLDIHTVGFELGYQFVFWRRLALDMVLIGPGMAGYNLKASLGSNLSQADKEKFFEKLNEALADKFPGYSHVIDEGEFKKTGTTNTTSIGYRYMVHIGFRF